MSEKLAFQQGLRDGTAILDNKGAIPATALLMDPVGHQFLSGTALSGDQNRIIGAGVIADQPENLEKGRALPQNHPLPPDLVQGLAKAPGFSDLVAVENCVAQGNGTDIDQVLDLIEPVGIEIEPVFLRTGIDDLNSTVNSLVPQEHGKAEDLPALDGQIFLQLFVMAAILSRVGNGHLAIFDDPPHDAGAIRIDLHPHDPFALHPHGV